MRSLVAIHHITSAYHGIHTGRIQECSRECILVLLEYPQVALYDVDPCLIRICLRGRDIQEQSVLYPW